MNISCNVEFIGLYKTPDVFVWLIIPFKLSGARSGPFEFRPTVIREINLVVFNIVLTIEVENEVI